MNKTLRNRMAWLLVAAYLPMLLASVLHVHHLPAAGEADCFKCVHHIAHPAHFGEYHSSEQTCLYCHVLSMPNLALALAAGLVVLMAAVRLCVLPSAAEASCSRGRVRLRAPPERG
ncbi:MAG: hypothetical protein IJ634_02895 [Bacteroidales bacterium]|nr:hypothetical protein [Bacteroidales bacterium]